MTSKARLPGVILLIPLLQAAPVAVAEDAPFTYSEDWSLVSAPPPPGPYQAVNIDPRVPGQDATPPITTDVESLQGWEQISDEMEAYPPAAGSPALPPAAELPIQQQVPGNYVPAPVPGTYESQLQRPPGIPGPGQYSTYRDMPPSGYYNPPAVQVEQEVPPPPVYDAMTGESGGGYGRPRRQ